MRLRLIATGAAALLLGASGLQAATPDTNGPANTPAVYAQAAAPQAQPPTQVEVSIDTGTSPWYTSPLWIGAGLVALLIIVLAIAAGRGSSAPTTTVIK